MKEKRSLIPRGCTVPSSEMRRISCLLRLLLLPEMGQRARIFMSEMPYTISIYENVVKPDADVNEFV